MGSRLRTLLAGLVVALVAVAGSGCGVGAGEAPGNTSLLVTENFGTRPLVDEDSPKVGGSDTVMRLLQRNTDDVGTRFGGNFVQSINDVDGGQRKGRPFDWFFYVNGEEADKGATAVRVDPGDHVWWDFHDWGGSNGIPAVVGQFPAPFTQSPGGRRLPTRVECVQPDDAACTLVHERLVDLGLPAALGGVARSFVQETLRVVVGPWQGMRTDDTVGLISRGPKASGVYATISDDGKHITLLDPTGKPVRTLGPGTGLIAATKREESAPVWVITGTDRTGILAAAAAFQEGALRGHFAVVLEHGRPVGVPIVR